MKNVTIKMPKSELERMNYYRAQPEAGIDGKLQAEFIRAAVEKCCDDLRLIRAGGVVMTFPNPSISGLPWGTPDQKAKVLEILKQADADLAKAGFAGSGLSDYASWLEYHLLEKTELEQQRFDRNFERDLMVESKINELIDAEWEDQQKKREARWSEDHTSED